MQQLEDQQRALNIFKQVAEKAEAHAQMAVVEATRWRTEAIAFRTLLREICQSK